MKRNHHEAMTVGAIEVAIATSGILITVIRTAIDNRRTKGNQDGTN